MNIITELNTISKRCPSYIRHISLYNLINFWASLILWIIAVVSTIIMIPEEYLTIQNFLPYIFAISFIVLNYFILKINLNFIYGSKSAYWALLVLFLLQCIEFQIGETGYSFSLGGIPFTFGLTIGHHFFKVNITAVIITSYLLSIKEKYELYLRKPVEERNPNYHLRK